MSDYTEADYHRDLGIVSWDEYDSELARIREGRSHVEELYDVALGIGDVSEAEQADAMRKLQESERYPWRAEWPADERLSRRGEEAHLASLYMSHLGESKTVAEAHVHREMSSAWNHHERLPAKLEGVKNRMNYERQRFQAKSPATTSMASEARATHQRAPRKPAALLREVREVQPPGRAAADDHQRSHAGRGDPPWTPEFRGAQPLTATPKRFDTDQETAPWHRWTRRETR